MILKHNHADKYLQDYHAGRIKMGLGIGESSMDNHIRFKPGQFVMLNGFDNVGKTAFILWYFLCLSVKHNLKWAIWSGENKPEQLTRQLIEFYAGRKLKDIPLKEVYTYSAQISQWFKFVDNKRTPTPQSLLAEFADADVDGCLIDPYTGLDKDRKVNQHDYNYQFCNTVREFVNSTQKSVYVNTHPNTEATRRRYPQGHELEGYPYPPSKADTEGGQPFANRCDDFLTGHRLTQHPDMRLEFLLYVRKVKDTETGGNCTDMNAPIRLHYNNGLGYVVNNYNPLSKVTQEPEVHIPKPLEPDGEFWDRIEKIENSREPF